MSMTVIVLLDYFVTKHLEMTRLTVITLTVTKSCRSYNHPGGGTITMANVGDMSPLVNIGPLPRLTVRIWELKW